MVGWIFGAHSPAMKKVPVCLGKDWGAINAASYCAHTIPLIHGWLTLRPHLTLIQDNASGHIGEVTMEELKKRGITACFWPPFSPDLNPNRGSMESNVLECHAAVTSR